MMPGFAIRVIYGYKMFWWVARVLLCSSECVLRVIL